MQLEVLQPQPPRQLSPTGGRPPRDSHANQEQQTSQLPPHQLQHLQPLPSPSSSASGLHHPPQRAPSSVSASAQLLLEVERFSDQYLLPSVGGAEADHRQQLHQEDRLPAGGPNINNGSSKQNDGNKDHQRSSPAGLVPVDAFAAIIQFSPTWTGAASSLEKRNQQIVHMYSLLVRLYEELRMQGSATSASSTISPTSGVMMISPVAALRQQPQQKQQQQFPHHYASSNTVTPVAVGLSPDSHQNGSSSHSHSTVFGTSSNDSRQQVQLLSMPKHSNNCKPHSGSNSGSNSNSFSPSLASFPAPRSHAQHQNGSTSVVPPVTPLGGSLVSMPAYAAAGGGGSSSEGKFSMSTPSGMSISHDMIAQLFVKEVQAERKSSDPAGFDTINNYVILDELGRGSCGKVMLASDEFGNQVAIKSMPCGTKASGTKHRFAGPIARSLPGSAVVTPLQSTTHFAPSHLLNSSGESGASSSPGLGGGGNLGPFFLSEPSPANSALSILGAKSFQAPVDSMVMREVAIMKKLRHKNIVQLKEVIHDEEDDMCHMVMDYICNGPLAEVDSTGHCASKIIQIGDAELAKRYISQAASGLQYLHRQDIVHRDIKPENLLVGPNHDVYLSDFGVSAVLREDKVVDIFAGTQAFFSPELARGDYDEAAKYGKQSDIWALGVTFYVLVFGRVPFHAPNVMALATTILQDPIPFPSHFPPGDPLREIFEGLLHKDPKQRWSLAQLRQHNAMRSGSPGGGGVPIVAHQQQQEEPSSLEHGPLSPFSRVTNGSLEDPMDIVQVSPQEEKNAIIAGSVTLCIPRFVEMNLEERDTTGPSPGSRTLTPVDGGFSNQGAGANATPIAVQFVRPSITVPNASPATHNNYVESDKVMMGASLLP